MTTAFSGKSIRLRPLHRAIALTTLCGCISAATLQAGDKFGKQVIPVTVDQLIHGTDTHHAIVHSPNVASSNQLVTDEPNRPNQAAESLVNGPTSPKPESNAVEPLAESIGPIRFIACVDHIDGQYQEGDLVRIAFRASEDCYLCIVNRDATGKTHLLFPNKFHPDGRVRKGEVVNYPSNVDGFQLRVGGPLGMEDIMLTASSQPMQLFPEVDTSLAPIAALSEHDIQEASKLLSRSISVEKLPVHQDLPLPITSSASTNDSSAAIAPSRIEKASVGRLRIQTRPKESR